MKHVKKITVVTVFAILISFFSLSVSIGALGTANAFKGSSIENKKIWEVNIRDISTMAVSSNYVSILKEPSMIDNGINYSLTLSNVNDYAQFQFNINNSGNQTSPIPFSGSATLDPEWVVTALQAASGLPWKQGSGWRLWLKSPSQLRQSCRNAKGISVPRLLFSQTFRSFEQLEC